MARHARNTSPALREVGDHFHVLAGPGDVLKVVGMTQTSHTENLERRDKPAWSKEMRELYIEGLATHGGPESCAVVRGGAGEALTGVRAGRAMEPRDQGGRGADVVR